MKTNFKIIVARFLRNDAGATAIEYGLIAALIAIIMIAGATKMGKKANSQMGCAAALVDVADEMEYHARYYETCVNFSSR